MAVTLAFPVLHRNTVDFNFFLYKFGFKAHSGKEIQEKISPAHFYFFPFNKIMMLPYSCCENQLQEFTFSS